MASRSWLGLGVVEGKTQPGLLGQTLEAVGTLIQPATVHDLYAPLSTRFDVATVDPDGWGTEEADLLGRLPGRNLYHPHLSLAASLLADPPG
jgi:hypothetical protein